MRLNLPVTQHEQVIPEGAMLVSTTNLKSRITYCNPHFVAISGYTREELLGQPHNMVRHPDMPAEAFRDMWDTLKSGAPWSAVVKNRCKNGDHYWVVANATPVHENGRTVGYLSVRTRPTREQIEQAEALYARMRQEAANGELKTRLRGGRVIKSGGCAIGRSLAAPTLSRRIGVVTFMLSAIGWALGHYFGQFGVWSLIAGLGATSLLSSAASYILGQSMVRPLQEAITFTNLLAAGDLSAPLQSRPSGEFGKLFRALGQLKVNLQAVVADVQHESNGVLASSDEIACGNHDLSERTEAQASHLEATAVSLGDLTSTMKKGVDSALEAGVLGNQAVVVAGEGNDVMSRVVSTMERISQSSNQIGDIIQVIEDISFQTNILALNAAVEAARAGEQGRGFAVVAEEVRGLAQRTSNAAKEIKVLIDESTVQVAEGGALVDNAGKTISNVVTAVQQVNGLIEGIAGAATEQSDGLSKINQAMRQLDSVTRQNTAMVEELATSASSLQAQSKVMQESVKIFRL